MVAGGGERRHRDSGGGVPREAMMPRIATAPASHHTTRKTNANHSPLAHQHLSGSAQGYRLGNGRGGWRLTPTRLLPPGDTVDRAGAPVAAITGIRLRTLLATGNLDEPGQFERATRLTPNSPASPWTTVTTRGGWFGATWSCRAAGVPGASRGRASAAAIASAGSRRARPAPCSCWLPADNRRQDVPRTSLRRARAPDRVSGRHTPGVEATAPPCRADIPLVSC